MTKITNNPSGKALSSSDWLYQHHVAKLAERKAFLKHFFKTFKPKVIVDLGCATGLWLELANDLVDDECEFIGIDSDENAIREAKKRSKIWNRKVSFIMSDFTDYSNLPSADLYFAFNICPYISSIDQLMEEIRLKLTPKGRLLLRQYDGAAIRFGPMDHELRIEIEKVLFNSINQSKMFRHYDLDRVYNAIDNSSFNNKDVDLELFKRTTPFPKDFINYYNNTIKWTMNYLSLNMKAKLSDWHKRHIINNHPSYFYEVDLIAIMTR